MTTNRGGFFVKIQSSNLHLSALKSYQKQEAKAQEVKVQGAASKKDAVELSGAAQALSALIKDGTDEAEISQRALEIKAQLNKGTYKPSVDKIAASLAERLIHERKSNK